MRSLCLQERCPIRLHSGFKANVQMRLHFTKQHTSTCMRLQDLQYSLGLLLKTVGGANGIIDLDELSATVPPDDPHFAPLSIVCAEDTANKGGGTVYPLERLDAVGQFAHANGAKSHLDGARLFNAVAASGVSAARRAQYYDTVSICFPKGWEPRLGLHSVYPNR